MYESLIPLTPAKSPVSRSRWFAKFSGECPPISALADRARVKILFALSNGEELCVCDVAHVLGVSISTASHQLRKLRDLKLLKYRNDGKMAYYSLRNQLAARLVADTLEEVGCLMGASPLYVLQERLSEAIRAPKCHRCGRLHKTVEALASCKAGRHELAAILSEAKSVFTAKEYVGSVGTSNRLTSTTSDEGTSSRSA